MKQHLINKTFIFCFFVISLASCTKPSNWLCSDITSYNSDYNSSDLIYRNPSNFIEIEFLNINDIISCFLNIINSEISKSCKNIPLALSTKNRSIETIGYLREGNQKISLDEQTMEFIINELRSNQTITIHLDDIEESIDPIFFSKKYKKLLESNSFYSKFIKSIY